MTVPEAQLAKSHIWPQKPSSLPLNSLELGKAAALLIADGTPDEDRLTLAQAFGYRLVSAWWRSIASQDSAQPALRPPLQPISTAGLPQQAETLADRIGEATARFDVEVAAFHLGLAYTSMLPRQYRAGLGIYYTPPALASRLIEQATASGVDWARCRTLDPACGGGAFLAPVARRILSELRHCSPRILVENIANRLRGYEIDPFGAWLSQVTLDAVLLSVTRAAGSQLPVVVTVCDSLRACQPDGGFDLVIGNPPYGRIGLDSVDRTRFKRSLFGHANLYGVFTDMALRHARIGGVIAFVTPTSFLAGEYFKNLRSLLGREASPATLDFISARKGIFEDVLQETLLATYKRGSTTNSVSVHELTPTGDLGFSVRDAGAFSLPTDPSRPWVLPRCVELAPLARRLAHMKHRLADWGFMVSTGPLVWNRFKSQLANNPGPNRHPLIWAEAITSDGRFAWRAEKRGHTLWFETDAGDDWLVTNTPCVLVQRTTAKEQCRRLISAALPVGFLDTHGAVVIENHLNMLKPIVDQPPVPADVLSAFLNTAAADRAFRCLSGSVAVSAYELEALPLPAPAKLGSLCRLVRGNAGRPQIESECERLYDGSA